MSLTVRDAIAELRSLNRDQVIEVIGHADVRGLDVRHSRTAGSAADHLASTVDSGGGAVRSFPDDLEISLVFRVVNAKAGKSANDLDRTPPPTAGALPAGVAAAPDGSVIRLAFAALDEHYRKAVAAIELGDVGTAADALVDGANALDDVQRNARGES